jgi:hypothetical protein
MTETAGYTLVLLDEQGVEIRREPDIYGREVKWIALGEYGYTLLRQVEENGVTVRYFQRGRLDD